MQAAAGRVRGLAGHHPVRAQPGHAPDRRRDRGSAPTRSSRPRRRNTGKPVALTPVEEIPPDGGPDPVLRRRRPGARGPVGRASTWQDHTSMIRREPIGVCAQVTPWNYPMMMAVWKFAPGHRRGQHGRAQAVRHHAGHHPAAGRDRGRVPAAGRVQRGLRRPRHRPRAGRAPDAAAWCRSPVRCGRAWRSPRTAADDLKRVHLELGGKAPVVVFDDADIEAAAEGIAGAGYFNAGQDCTAATRVLAGPGVARRPDRGAGRAGRGTTTGGARRARTPTSAR